MHVAATLTQHSRTITHAPMIVNSRPPILKWLYSLVILFFCFYTSHKKSQTGLSR